MMVSIALSANNHEVYFDAETSHAVTHFAQHPALVDAVRRSIEKLTLTGDRLRMEIDTGEIVGTTDLVETTADDDIVYALRPMRTAYARFVKDKNATPTSSIVIDIRKNTEGQYLLHTAFIGKLTPSFPGDSDPYEGERSRAFWSQHALVWGSQEIIPGTETTVCPW